MTLMLALAVTLLIEALSAVSLIAVTARLRLVADRRLGIEAELALNSSIADFRVHEAAELNRLLRGETAVLPPRTRPGNWEAEATASRSAAGELTVLTVRVRRRDARGHLVAAREGTLLLGAGTADTAIVIGHWPRF